MLVDYPPDLCGFLRFTLHSGVSFQNTELLQKDNLFLSFLIFLYWAVFRVVELVGDCHVWLT